MTKPRSTIASVKAYQILDSRGNPTLRCTVTLANGVTGTAAVPSGASTGAHEAVELRDNDKSVYCGKGVLKAVANVNGPIAKLLKGMNAFEQAAVDQAMIELDATKNKGSLGANAILAASLAVAHAAANCQKIPLYQLLGGAEANLLPVPLMNIFNGGQHANNGIDVQEFMVVPHGFTTFSDALRAGVETFHALKKLLADAGHSTAVGDEGGFAPNLGSNEAALQMVLKAITAAGYEPGEQIGIALDVAATELFEQGDYTFDGKQLTGDALVDVWQDWCERYPIVSIEDGLDEDDWKTWKALTDRIGDRVQLVGDDLFVTNPKRLKRGIDTQTANAILVKVNQIGTLSETIQAVLDAQNAGFASISSHRSGETEDVTIADLAVGLGMGQIKTGSASRSDRIAKYNRLLMIEQELGSRAQFAGSIFANHGFFRG